MNDLFWLDTGAGRPVVLLHGGFLDHRMWDDQIPALAARYRVIAPDARGHGRSANATGPFRHTDDLAALLRHLTTGPAILVGVSMGAGIAVDTALEHPELVGAVVVSGAGTSEPDFTDPWITRTWTAWHTAMASGDLDTAVEAFTLFAAGPDRTLDDLAPDLVARLREMNRSTLSKHAPDEPDLSIPVHDTWDRAATIDVPVLAINGALDSPDHLGMAERLTRTVAHGHVILDGHLAADRPHRCRPALPFQQTPQARNERPSGDRLWCRLALAPGGRTAGAGPGPRPPTPRRTAGPPDRRTAGPPAEGVRRTGVTAGFPVTHAGLRELCFDRAPDWHSRFRTWGGSCVFTTPR